MDVLVGVGDAPAVALVEVGHLRSFQASTSSSALLDVGSRRSVVVVSSVARAGLDPREPVVAGGGSAARGGGARTGADPGLLPALVLLRGVAGGEGEGRRRARSPGAEVAAQVGQHRLQRVVAVRGGRDQLHRQVAVRHGGVHGDRPEVVGADPDDHHVVAVRGRAQRQERSLQLLRDRRIGGGDQGLRDRLRRDVAAVGAVCCTGAIAAIAEAEGSAAAGAVGGGRDRRRARGDRGGGIGRGGDQSRCRSGRGGRVRRAVAGIGVRARDGSARGADPAVARGVGGCGGRRRRHGRHRDDRHGLRHVGATADASVGAVGCADAAASSSVSSA